MPLSDSITVTTRYAEPPLGVPSLQIPICAFLPTSDQRTAWVAAYGSDMDARARVERAVKAYKDRQKAWIKTRKEKDKDATVSPKLAKAMETIAATISSSVFGCSSLSWSWQIEWCWISTKVWGNSEAYILTTFSAFLGPS